MYDELAKVICTIMNEDCLSSQCKPSDIGTNKHCLTTRINYVTIIFEARRCECEFQLHVSEFSYVEPYVKNI